MSGKGFALRLVVLMMAVVMAAGCAGTERMRGDAGAAGEPTMPQTLQALQASQANASPEEPAAPQPAAGAAVVAPGVAPVTADAEVAREIKKDVPYVPTDEAVVEAMLRLGEVDKDDVVYDLGCGDGRIVVMAARRFGARGVGVDIDPERIKESNQNAREAGVTGRVRFERQNLFDAQIRDATAVMLYLLPSINLKLRPKLLSELRPGTRVVSHSFEMEDWAPDQTEMVGGTTILLWVIPANMSGTWRWTQAGAAGSEQCRLDVMQHFQKMNMVLTEGSQEGNRRTTIEDVRLEGDRVRFTLDRTEGPDLRFEGRVNGDEIVGTMEEIGDAGMGSKRAEWRARREAGTAVPLDTGAAAGEGSATPVNAAMR